MSDAVDKNELRKPPRLRAGSRVAAVTLSWGGPGAIPARYEAGKRQLEEAFGVTVVEMAHTCAAPEWIADHPEARAADLMSAFADDSIDGIVATIGGHDSIRLLPWLDLAVIASNPKVVLGYSDTTVTHFACRKAGLTSFYGPSIMSGFAENCGLHDYLRDSVVRTVFSADVPGDIPANTNGWTVEYLDWAEPGNQARRRALQPSSPWRFLQGSGSSRGRLLGGCMEVLPALRGTPLWPQLHEWRNAILFLETSEAGASPEDLLRELRVYAAEGVLSELAGILFGRPGGQIDPARFALYDEVLLQVVRDENGLDALPVVAGMDFGHTDPMMVMPLGALAEIDADAGTFALLEASVR